MKKMFVSVVIYSLFLSYSNGDFVESSQLEYDFVIDAILGHLQTFHLTLQDIDLQAEEKIAEWIFGGGTAGCVVASRLSENEKHSVLVLEAGISDRDYPEVDIPQKMGRLQKTHIDWEFKTEPMKNSSRDLINQQSHWPIGKVLGGSSSHNFLDVVRGSPHDFDHWRDLGNEGWGFDQVLHYFKKSENNRNPKYCDTEYHNAGGLWTVETSAFTKLGEYIIQGAEELGHKQLDINGETIEGFDIVQMSTRYGRRMSTASAFLWPARRRHNLHIMLEAHVIKILLDGKTATGVEYEKSGRRITVTARKEVIVSAGTIMSPQILMQSGIGPKSHLEEFGIDVIADLPVGIGLEDHYATLISFTTNATSLSITEDKLKDPMEKFHYVFGGSGVYATSGQQAQGFERSVFQPKEHKFPYLQYIYLGYLIGNHKSQEETFSKILGLKPEMTVRDRAKWTKTLGLLKECLYIPQRYDNGIQTVERLIQDNRIMLQKDRTKKYKFSDFKNQRGKSGFTVYILHLHPRNLTGTLKLRSTDPYDKPVINIEYVNHPDDVKDMIQGFRTNMALLNTKSLQKIGIAYEAPHHQGCLQHKFDTDNYWECYLRHRTVTGYHPTSTCRMAPGPDGVVDNKLRVKGIQKLRVVDASIMPNMTSGNTMTPTIMIAEKASDMIKQQYA